MGDRAFEHSSKAGDFNKGIVYDQTLVTRTRTVGKSNLQRPEHQVGTGQEALHWTMAALTLGIGQAQ